MAHKLTKAQQQERQEAIAELRGYLAPGDRVHAIVRDVSRSGMSRRISLLLLATEKDAAPTPMYITNLVARAIGWRVVNSNGNWAIHVEGCGMDMVFHTVDVLSRTLGPEYVGKLRAETL
jgi:hypothetical protein